MKGATVCGGEQRVKNIYMSDSHKLTIEIVPSQSTENAAEFLLQYEGKNIYHDFKAVDRNLFLATLRRLFCLYCKNNNNIALDIFLLGALHF